MLVPSPFSLPFDDEIRFVKNARSLKVQCLHGCLVGLYAVRRIVNDDLGKLLLVRACAIGYSFVK